jgi:hypothetical protein
MTSVSRNAPCPCGSGKKYKHSCLGRSEEATTELGRLPHRLLDEERATHEAIFAWMERRYGRDWATPALESVLAGDEIDDSGAQILGPWLIYLCPFDGATPAARYAAERGPKLTDAERRTIEVHGAARLSLWEVRRVDPGVGLELYDLLVQEPRFVHDVRASREAVPWTVMLAAIAVYPEVCVFTGVHGLTLTPDEGVFAVREARRMLRVRTRPAPPERLAAAEFQVDLLQLWDDLLIARDESPLPRVQNSDGDPILVCTDYFDVKAGAEDEVLRRLSAIEGADLRESDDGPVVWFLRETKSEFTTFEKTEIARARFTGKRLTVETNSARRADLMRARVTEALAGLARHRTRKTVDPLTILEQSPEDDAAPDPQPPSDPRLRAAMRDVIERHYAAWPDMALPALGGLTPREAARAPRSRDELVQLLKQMETMNERKDDNVRFDFDRIRRELGLELDAKS